MSTRSCGKCTACCTTLAVGSIGKPDFQRCQHLHKFGCRIYARRPADCRGYECLWLQGELDELTGLGELGELGELVGRDLRPDRLGVVFTAGISHKLGGVVLLTELRDNAVEKDTVRQVVDVLGKSFLVIHVTKNLRTVLTGPPEQIKGICAKMNELRLEAS